MSRLAHQGVATIDQFINGVGATKKAADGGTPLSEPGSIGGETSHPVKKVDDRLEKAKEGERSAENSKDVKADQPMSVEHAPEASTKNAASIFNLANRFAKKADGAVSTPGSAEDDHLAVTMKVAPTGEDSANETNKAKAGKEDKKQGNMGGTSHPASTENDQLDGHKYAADTPIEKLAADMNVLGDNILATLQHVFQSGGIHVPASASTNKQAAAQHSNAVDPQLAYLVGNELAGLISGNFDKQASDAMVHTTLTEIIKQGSDDADLFIEYASNFLKHAEEEPPMEGTEEPPMPEGGGAEPPMPGGGGMGGAEGGDDGSAMLSALGGGGGGAEGMDGGMGGGAGGVDPQAMEVVKAILSLGVQPEELIQAIQSQGGGGGGAEPPMPGGGGGDPMAAMAGAGGGGMGGGMETAANAGAKKTNQSGQKQAMDYLVEILQRSGVRK